MSIFVNRQMEYDDQSFSDLVYAKSREVNFHPHTIAFDRLQSPNVTDIAVNHHWAFESDESGAITGLLLPFGSRLVLANFDKFNELKTLSFDAGWILKDAAFSLASDPFSQSVDVTQLPKLERLYFSKGFQGTRLPNGLDLSVLGKLDNFEHLQIPSSSFGSDYAGFDKITNLKSLTLFGRPSAKIINELAWLTKLQKLTIVYASGNKPSTKWRTTVATLLPGVTIFYVDELKRRPDTTPAFEEHLKKKSLELRSRLLKTHASIDGSNN